MTSTATLLRARHLAPIVGKILDDGAVLLTAIASWPPAAMQTSNRKLPPLSLISATPRCSPEG